MPEYPILFSGPMVRAILEGRKTQTRRIMKHNLPFDGPRGREWYPGGEKAGFHAHYCTGDAIDVPNGWASQWCPFGMQGDRLWVKQFRLSTRHAAF